MRQGKWKYLREGKNEFLFDLYVDEREQAGFAVAKPEVLAKLKQEFSEWESQVVAYPNN